MFKSLKIWFGIFKNKKAFYIAPLAMALIVIVIFILIATYNTQVKQTTIDIAKSFTGNHS